MSDFQKDPVALMCDIGELVGLFDFESGLDSFLKRAVSMVAWHMRAAVCSIYLYEAKTQDLVLRANQGLNPALVGRLRFALGEGLVGTSLKTLKPICEANGRDNPNYKYVPDSGEEAFVSYLAVPITRKMNPVGVIVVQDPQYNYFTANDIQALRVIASQLAGVVENAHLLLALRKNQDAVSTSADGPGGKLETDGPEALLLATGTHCIPGIWAAGGMAMGLSTRIGHYLERTALNAPAPEGLTEADFDRAAALTERQLLELQRRLQDKIQDAASMIFGAHVLMLKDDAFAGEIRLKIRAGKNPWDAVMEEIRHYADLFEHSPNSLMREKVLDVEDLGHRLLHNLNPAATEADMPDYTGQIVIAESLLPSDILKLSAEGAAGLILLGTGQHSHVAILAKALDLPLVVCGDRRLLAVPEKTPVLLDAKGGQIVIRPGEEAIQTMRELLRNLATTEQLARRSKPETRTLDGTRVTLMANLNLVSELDLAMSAKVEGIGLYRTEFPFIIRNAFPTEEEQYVGYKSVLERMAGKPVVFRTLDIGGDKALSYFPTPHESNPFLGLRALRFSLRNPEIFKQQLRALLRAAHVSERAKIMFPLVASLDEYWTAKEITLACYRDLRAEGIPCRLPEIGVMIEIPATAMLAADFAKAADFLSIGTNDLIQYLLAVDRTNSAVSSFFSPHHPAVLRTLARIAEAVKPTGKALSLCGNLGSDVQMLPFLLGIGLRTISIDSASIPAVQEAIGKINIDEAEWQAREMLTFTRISEVEAYLEDLRKS